MTDKPDYRFHCKVVDAATGETVIRDWCSISDVGPMGECETVDYAVADTLRKFQSRARADYEAKNYQVPA